MATSSAHASLDILNDQNTIVLLLLDRYSDLVFLDDVTDVSCKRCRRVLLQHSVSNCGHLLCSNCQHDLMEGKEPKCQECSENKPGTSGQNIEVEEQVFGLMVHCLNHNYGCKQKMELRQIAEHLESCEYTKEADSSELFSTDTNSQKAVVDSIQTMSEKINYLTLAISQLKLTKDHLIQKIKEMNDEQYLDDEIKCKELERRINKTSIAIKRGVMKIKIDEDHSRFSVELHAELSKMDETANQHVEKAVTQSQAVNDDRNKVVEDKSTKRERTKKIKRWNILAEKTRLPRQIEERSNQKLSEMGEKATHLNREKAEMGIKESEAECKEFDQKREMSKATEILSRTQDNVSAELNELSQDIINSEMDSKQMSEIDLNQRVGSIPYLTEEIEGKTQESNKSPRTDVKIESDKNLAKMVQSENEIKTTMAQMNNEQDKIVALDKTSVHQGITESKSDKSKLEFKKPELKMPEDSVVPEYNILMLGESGSGKSTFINSLANYIHYEQLNDALCGGPGRCLIPTTIVVTDDNYQEKQILIAITEDCEVKVREPNPTCRTYVIDYKECQMRLIDTSGYERSSDSRLSAKILKFIVDCKFGINVIAMVVQSNQPQLHPHLSDLFQSLVGHTSIRVLFLLSHSETTDYRPGDVRVQLKQLLAMDCLPSGAGLSKDNTYCFDNKGFLYLLGKQSGHSYGSQFENSCHRAWNHSALECKRLLQSLTANRIRSLIPPQFTTNLLINIDANGCHYLCSDYIKRISQKNDRYQKELSHVNEKKEQLRQALNSYLQGGNKVYYEVRKTNVSPPEYVCTSSKCRKDIETIDGTVKQHFPRRCPSPTVMEYISMSNCSHCGCRKKDHKTLYYTTNLEEYQIDLEASPVIIKIRSEIVEIEQRIDELRKKMKEYVTIESISNAFYKLSKSQLNDESDLGPNYCDRDTNKPKGKGQATSVDHLLQLQKQLFDLEMHGEKIKRLFIQNQ